MQDKLPDLTVNGCNHNKRARKEECNVTAYNTPITLRSQSLPWPIGTLPSAKPAGNVVIGGNVVLHKIFH